MSSKRITPISYTSAVKEYDLFLIISGDMFITVPQHVVAK
jgi:hypothetical protein